MLTTAQRISMLECPKGPVDVLIDTDAYNEIDDQFAIAYALKAKKKISVRGLVAAPFHNARSSGPKDGMEKSFQEILKLLALTGESVPAYRGSESYLPDERTPLDSEGARCLAGTAAAYTPERPLYVVALGAITNVASALLMRPEIAGRMVVVWLGGHALEWTDNQEFNIRQDVAAARVVFGSGAPLVMLPCQGVVSHFLTTGPELAYWLRGRNALCDFLVQNTVDEVNKYAHNRVWSRVIWDVTAVAWLLNDGDRFMQSKLIPTPIPQYDHHWSLTPANPLCRYVYAIRRDALMGDLFARLTEEKRT